MANLGSPKTNRGLRLGDPIATSMEPPWGHVAVAKKISREKSINHIVTQFSSQFTACFAGHFPMGKPSGFHHGESVITRSVRTYLLGAKN